MSPGDEPLRQHGEGQVPEFTDSAWKAHPGVSRIVGVPGDPSVTDHGRDTAHRTNADHPGGVVYSVVPLLNHNPIWKKSLHLAANWRLFGIGRHTGHNRSIFIFHP